MYLNHFRNYKNFENQNITGVITSVERLEKRFVLINFYENKNLSVSKNYPPYQQYLDLTGVLNENLVKNENPNLFVKHNERFLYLVNKPIKLFYKDEMYGLKEDLWKKNLNSILVFELFRKYKKLFDRLEKKKWFFFLTLAKKFFFNRNINRFLYNFNYGNLFIKNFLKKFLRKSILAFFMFLTKNLKNSPKKAVVKQQFFLLLNHCTNKGLFFVIPGITERFILPLTFLKNLKKTFKNEILMQRFNLKLNTCFFFKILKISKSKSNIKSFLLQNYFVRKFSNFQKNNFKKNSFKIKQNFSKKKHKAKFPV